MGGSHLRAEEGVGEGRGGQGCKGSVAQIVAAVARQAAGTPHDKCVHLLW